jgi:type III pantothenate kinase
MLLTVDIGNSNIVLAFFESADEPAVAMKHTVTEATQDAKVYAKIFTELFAAAKIEFSAIEKVLVSSVVPALTAEIKAVIQDLVDAPIAEFNSKHYGKLPVSIPESARNEIGADILANAVLAFYRYKKACIIVDFGTALTFTAVDGKGNIRGVAIAPGLQTACKSLFSNTAQLPTVFLVEPESALGLDTVTAIQSGIVLGYKGLVTSLLQRMQAEIGESCTRIATGGLSSVFKNAGDIFDTIDIGFTTQGLAVILEKFI